MFTVSWTRSGRTVRVDTLIISINAEVNIPSLNASVFSLAMLEIHCFSELHRFPTAALLNYTQKCVSVNLETCSDVLSLYNKSYSFPAECTVNTVEYT